MKSPLVTHDDFVAEAEKIGGKLIAWINIEDGAGWVAINVRTRWFTFGLFDAVLLHLLDQTLMSQIAIGIRANLHVSWRMTRPS